MRPLIALAALASLAGSPAWADEAIKTGGAQALPAMADAVQPLPGRQASPHEIGDWARGVIAGAPAADDAPASGSGCAAPADRKPHGEVWAGVGTGGYRELGGVVTQPVGDCGSVTIAVSRSGGRFASRR